MLSRLRSKRLVFLLLLHINGFNNPKAPFLTLTLVFYMILFFYRLFYRLTVTRSLLKLKLKVSFNGHPLSRGCSQSWTLCVLAWEMCLVDVFVSSRRSRPRPAFASSDLSSVKLWRRWTNCTTSHLSIWRSQPFLPQACYIVFINHVKV